MMCFNFTLQFLSEIKYLTYHTYEYNIKLN